MESNKERKVLNLAILVLVLESRRGHLKWKVTELSAKAKISRPLIYRYLGGSKEAILRAALSEFLIWFYGQGLSFRDAGFANAVREIREFLRAKPEPILFYQKWRAVEGSWISAMLKNAEEEFRERLAEAFPHLNAAQCLLAHALLHGLVTAPFLSEDQAAGGARELTSMLEGPR